MNLNDISTSTFVLIALGVMCVPFCGMLTLIIFAGMAAKKAAAFIVNERAAERRRRDAEKTRQEDERQAERDRRNMERFTQAQATPAQSLPTQDEAISGNDLHRVDAFVRGEERLTPNQLVVELLHAALAA
jgi:hypothetical protein